MFKIKHVLVLCLLMVLGASVSHAQLLSSTALTISPGNTVTAGTAVTLNVTVTLAPSAAPAPLGQVTFCDATAAHCEDAAIFGTAQLSSSGNAALKFTPGAGTYSIMAVFAGIPGYAGSSSTSQSLTVNGNASYITTTLAIAAGGIGNYSLTGVVTAFGRGPIPGTLSFLDTSNGNALVTTAALNALSLGYQWVGAPDVGTDTFSEYSVVADFDGDGINDIAVSNATTGDITVALGNGDGTFRAPTNIAACDSPLKLVAGDFNGDGVIDLAVACQSDGAVEVLIGNGNGTFQLNRYFLDGIPTGLAVGDFNNDGNLDLAATIEADSFVQVLFGDGTGAFSLSSGCGECSDLFPVGNGAFGIVAADVNRDGNLDLVVANNADATISVLLGNGDGTFQGQSTFTVGTGPTDLAVADFNGDGFPDLAVGASDGTISILLNQAGASYTQQTISTTGSVNGLAAADLNGDGNMDLAAANLLGGSVEAFLGNGDGTFQPPASISSTGANPNSVAVGDLNNDGLPDLVVANEGTEGSPSVATILLSAQTESATATGVSILGAGTHNVLASYPGDAERAPSQSSNTVALQGTAQTSTTFTVAPNPATFGQTVTFTATVSPTPTGESLGTVTFFAGAAQLGVGNVNSLGVATFTTNNLAVGTISVFAVYSGNADGYAGSTSSSQDLTVNQASTTTSLSASPSPAVTGQTVTLTATISPAPTGSPLGVVTFFENGSSIGTMNVNSSGVAVFTTSSLPAGVLALTAVYGGNTNFLGSSSSPTSLTVLQATTTALTASPSPSTFGQSVTLTATISPVPTGTPLGSVTFFDGETQLGTGTVNASGVATFATASLATGLHVLEADYSGNAAFAVSVSTTVNLTVNPAVTGVALTGAPNPVTFGGSVTLTATVTPAPTGAPLGSVNFFNGATQIGTGTVNASGVATLATTTLPVGTLSLTATYSGNANFATSTSAALSLVVNQVATSTALTAAPSPAVTGQSVTLTATVTPIPTGTPFGTVAFFNGATQIGTGNVSASGVATLATSSLPAGTLSLTATYSGNTDFAASTSSATSLTVLAATTTGVTASPNPSTFGQTVTLTATVTPAPTGAPLGSVNFFNGATQIGTGTVNASGVATFAAAGFAVGAQSITATYSGNAGFAASTSTALTVTVNVAPTTVVLTGSPNPAVFGASVTLTATVSPVPTGAPLGSVNFFNGATQIGTGTVNASGVATLATTTLPVGTLSLTATYSGNANFGGATSSALSFVVNPTPTATALTAAPSPAVTGQSVTLTATVTPIPTGAPLGTVAFFNGATQVGSTAVNASGVATFTTSSLPAGTLSLTATYSGNTDFAGSTSSATSLTVLAATTTGVTASPNPSTFGQTVTLTATVTPMPTGTPLGTVNFFNGATQIGTGTVNASGVATFAAAGLAVGAQSITAPIPAMQVLPRPLPRLSPSP